MFFADSVVLNSQKEKILWLQILQAVATTRMQREGFLTLTLTLTLTLG